MSTITIRRATIDDLDEFVALRLKLFRESGYLHSEESLPELIEATRAYLSENLPTGRFLAWVALVGKQLIGISGLIFFQKPPTEENLSGFEAYVMNMYTLPEWRGQGVATAFMQEIIKYVQNTSARRIWLHTTKDGQAVYEHCGFVFTHGDMELIW
jgi:GNAT superfamily N-acetyltransferase